jgi:hypothetical protein
MDTSPRAIAVTLAASVGIALLALLLFVLPAELGVDPLGVGDRLGVTGMSANDVPALVQQQASYRQDYVEFPLGPFESVEYKYALSAGQAMVYSWQAEGEVVYDLHSELSGKGPEDAISFLPGRSDAQHGSFVAPHDGIHGWFWENRGAYEVTVKLSASGFFAESTTFSPAGEYTREL